MTHSQAIKTENKKNIRVLQENSLQTVWMQFFNHHKKINKINKIKLKKSYPCQFLGKAKQGKCLPKAHIPDYFTECFSATQV